MSTVSGILNVSTDRDYFAEGSPKLSLSVLTFKYPDTVVETKTQFLQCKNNVREVRSSPAFEP